MKQRYFLLIGLITAVICVAEGLYYLSKHTSSSQQKPVLKTPAPLPKEVTITLDKTGFSPKEVSIHSGTAIHWKNVSGDKQTVNSDNYPTNQLHKELNFGIFANNSSVTYVFTKPGTYGYHNQFHPEEQGSIIVVQ